MGELLYKCLDNQLRSCNGGTHRWVPWKWVTVTGKLEPCHRGIHLCRAEDLPHWITDTVYCAETRGSFIEASNKVVAAKARITTRVPHWGRGRMTLWAADCAEHVLPYFEKRYPKDSRPRDAIETIRRVVTGVVAASADAASADAATAAAAASADAASADAAYAYAASAAAAASADAASAASAASADAAAASAAAADAGNAAERVWQAERLAMYFTGWLPPAAEPYRAVIDA